MIALYTFLLMAQAQEAAPQVTVQKEIVYQKETTIDFSGSKVEGENQVPPAFFVTKMQTPNGESLLSERLKFGLKNYNELGF